MSRMDALIDVYARVAQYSWERSVVGPERVLWLAVYPPRRTSGGSCAGWRSSRSPRSGPGKRCELEQ